MSYADFDSWLNDLKNEHSVTVYTSGAVTTGRLQDTYASALFSSRGTVATPTTSVACNRQDPGAINAQLANYSPKSAYVIGGRFCNTSARGTCILIDRLNHSGGLDGTLTTTQTTNLPTAALTRYTNGEGVMAALVIHTGLGATASTFVVSYTNQDGTPGKTSIANVIGGTTHNATGRLIPITLASGDRGVRSVESVTLAGTTGTVGNFGVVLFRPIAMFSIETLLPIVSDIISGCTAGGLEAVLDDACLTLVQILETGGSTSGGVNSFFFGEA